MRTGWWSKHQGFVAFVIFVSIAVPVLIAGTLISESEAEARAGYEERQMRALESIARSMSKLERCK